MASINLKDWGWKGESSETIGRVIEEQRSSYSIITEQGIVSAQLAGKFLQAKLDRLERPVVGDWLVIRPLWAEKKAVIQEILPRKSLLKRKAAGETENIQPLAANVDLTFIVTSMNRDFNEKRIHRYLTIAHESGSRVAILLTKSDLAPESVSTALEMAAKYSVPCIALSSLSGEGVNQVRDLLLEGETVVFVGSSGVGKSTLVNALLGAEVQSVAEIRAEDDRGRHTTTSRRILKLPNNALLIDTPGLREIQLHASQSSGLEESFALVDSLSLQCKFTNCKHESEPNCAVKAALASGELSEELLASYTKLQKEMAHKARKENSALEAEEKRKWKKLSQEAQEKSRSKRS